MVAVRTGLDGLKEEGISQLTTSWSGCRIPVSYERTARDENTLSIVFKYTENGSLGQTLKVFGKLNEKLVASYVFKILEWFDYLYQSDLMHCDLKAANVLTTKLGNVNLDFRSTWAWWSSRSKTSPARRIGWLPTS
jgi:serine/threonine protein kinase